MRRGVVEDKLHQYRLFCQRRHPVSRYQQSNRSILAAEINMDQTDRVDATFQITLEHVDGNDRCHVFRLAFDSSTHRLLLRYPEVTGLRFTDSARAQIAEWKTRFLITCPLDEFVLNPDARIAFDLKAHINVQPDRNHRWTIQLPAGQINAHYVFTVNPDMERYDFLAKRSRFAAITKPWGGTLESNVVQFTVAAAEASRGKAE